MAENPVGAGQPERGAGTLPDPESVHRSVRAAVARLRGQLTVIKQHAHVELSAKPGFTVALDAEPDRDPAAELSAPEPSPLDSSAQASAGLNSAGLNSLGLDFSGPAPTGPGSAAPPPDPAPTA